MISSQEIAQMVGAIIIYGFFFVLTAGLYAMLYASGRLFEKPWLVKVSYVFAAAELLSAIGMVATGYLDRFWVNLILFSAITYLFIPQAMWWVVVNFHKEFESEEHAH
ncbi:hypothetical protein [Oceanithermus sp.]|uniref:hypothetical protein n=1 Tax=Oceanithermus sp. TaxID=2268145 RepID=UPI0025D66F31|nr:hypothetical protein [Oceanithermus sp.]